MTSANPDPDYFAEIVHVLCAEFELDASQIQLDAHLQDDLDIDSIDAVDLLVHMKELTGRNFSADTLKDVKTVSDIVTLLRQS